MKNNEQNAQGAIREVVDKVSNMRTEDVASAAGELGERVGAEARKMGRQIQSRVRSLDEATVPDMFRNAPKLISPKVHAWLDLAVIGYFAALGVWCVTRGKGRAAIAAFVNAGMVAGVSALTDYEGNGQKPISFKLHGTLDAVQATKAALAPALYGFAGEPESAFFYGQAANEVAVIASTDWDKGMPGKSRRSAA